MTRKSFPQKRPFDFQRHEHNQSQPQMIPFVERLGAVIRRFGPDRFTVAEIGGEEALREMKAYTAGTSRLNTSYGFDFLYAENLNPGVISRALGRWSGDAGEGWPSWAFSNHDAPRVVSRWGDDEHSDEWARLLLTLLMSLRGNVFLYQGEELGLPQAVIPFDRLRDPEAIANWPLTLGRDGARTPMPWSGDLPFGGFSTIEPWLPIPPEHLARAVSSQSENDTSVLAFARRLVALRRSHAALRLGSFHPLDLPAPLLGFERMTDGETVRCIFNLGKTALPCPPQPSHSVLFATGAVDLKRNVLPPRSAALLLL